MVTVSQSFWNYAKNINKRASLEDAFVAWANNNLKNIESVKKAWDEVHDDLRNIYANQPVMPPQIPAVAPNGSAQADESLLSMLTEEEQPNPNAIV